MAMGGWNWREHFEDKTTVGDIIIKHIEKEENAYIVLYRYSEGSYAMAIVSNATLTIGNFGAKLIPKNNTNEQQVFPWKSIYEIGQIGNMWFKYKNGEAVHKCVKLLGSMHGGYMLCLSDHTQYSLKFLFDISVCSYDLTNWYYCGLTPDGKMKEYKNG